LLRFEGFEDFESVEPGHLHIQEEQIRPLLLNRLERLRSVGTFDDDCHVRLVRDQGTDAFARERFVVGDNGA
jgi:hypothetical protein